jgi:uncharacterized protein YuzE
MSGAVSSLSSRYDAEADVLYISHGLSSPDRYLEEDDGLVWRIDRDGATYGVTILDFRFTWRDRCFALVQRLSAGLGIAEDRIAEALSH